MIGSAVADELVWRRYKGTVHAWRVVTLASAWTSVCGITAARVDLGDDTGTKHMNCILVAGNEIADRQGDSTWHH